ncbi:MAG TPA: cadmium-translocating P-type ATPase [Candidatus Faecousia intestinigallinarum]|nr:cadmium-translocating P-type ATPase [Candidatus Faecousia intestinigallinarum]
MAKKVYWISGLDCANCAAKIERKINAMPEVEEAAITFATGQLHMKAHDPDALLPQVLEIARSIEPGVVIAPKSGERPHQGEHTHAHHESCACGHAHHDHCGCDHAEHDHCTCEHTYAGHEHTPSHHHARQKEAHDHGGDSLLPILAGAGLFLLGLFLEYIHQEIPARLSFVAGYLTLGLPVLADAVKNMGKGHVLDENFLMSIATLGAFAIGEFPEAVGVMLFYRVGEFFEHKAVERSRSQIMEAIDLRPEVVTLESGETIPAEQAKVGDLLRLLPGDRIPLDGIIRAGESRIDTAPITGEPVPVRVGPGEAVLSGCVNTSGRLTMEVTKILSESMVTRILDSVENAAASKPKIDRFITRFARVYTPVVVALALGVAVIPSLVTGNWNYWVYTALSFLVMSCPCALVLSVPLAFFSGIGKGSKQGILFKGGVSIEAMAQVKAVAMDKTGTVTQGSFDVQEVQGGDEVLALCASCEQASNHPIAVSIVQAAKTQGLLLERPESLEEIPGHGLRAEVGGKEVLCGNEALMERYGVAVSHFQPRQMGTWVLVAVDGKLSGAIRIADAVKPEAGQAITELKRMGVTTAMLTGDSAETAAAVSRNLGIEEVHAKLLPGEKLERLQDIRARYGQVMFVGDGINDAPVLAGADVGAAMGSGADAAIEAADVVYMTSSVEAIPESLRIARNTKTIAWQNVVFALIVKFAVMILGLLGFASMWMAVFADSGVAMLCVLNSIRLLYSK